MNDDYPRGVDYVTKDRLYELYWGDHHTLSAIADKYGVSRGTIRRRFMADGIPRSGNHTHNTWAFKQLSKQTLYRLYWGDHLTTGDIADRFGVSRTVVLRTFNERGIPRRGDTDTPQTWVIKMRPRRKLFEWYWGERKTFAKIAAEQGVAPNFLSHYFQQHNVPTNVSSKDRWHGDIPVKYEWPDDGRDHQHEPLPDNPDGNKYMNEKPAYRDKDRLYELYWGLGLSAAHISERCRGNVNVNKYLREHGIPVRNHRKHISWEPHHGVPPMFEWPDGKPPSEVDDDDDGYQAFSWKNSHQKTAGD